jgi:hypothetical protein
MQIKHVLSGLLLVVFTITSYAFPANSDRKSLLTRKWKLVKVIENGKDQKIADYVETIYFVKDGSCQSNNEVEGKWYLLADQSTIVIDYNYDIANDTIAIVKIDSTQLTLRMKKNNVVTVLYLKPVIPLDFVPESNAQTKLLIKKWKVEQMLVGGKPDPDSQGQIIKLNANGELEDDVAVIGIWKFTQATQQLVLKDYEADETIITQVKTLKKDLLILTFSMKNQSYKARLIPF